MGRLGRTALAVLMVVVLGVAIEFSGARLRGNDLPLSGPEMPAAAASVPVVKPPAAIAPAASAKAAPRPVAPDLVAPPRLGAQSPEREPPRLPLSGIGLANLPKPDPTDWSGILLYRPVAENSAEFSAMGRHVAIAGIEGLRPDESCEDHGRSWPCGMRARTAFRAWLGGRAVECDLPKEKTGETESARCKRGKQDAGAWLVENGWARAVPDGPYEAQEKKARDRRKGMFGRAPVTEMPVLPLTPPIALPGLSQ